MNPRAVLFDLDGTLLDTLEDLADSMNAVLERLGHPTHPTDAYRHFVGDGVATMVSRSLPPDARSALHVERGVEAMLSEYGERWDRHTRPYDGVPEMLDGLFARDLRVVILSNKPHEFTLRTAEHLLGDWAFDRVWGVSARVPKKPDPAGALALAEALGLPVSAFLYVGDTGTDMQTAVAAGMQPHGALWGFRDAEELGAAGARTLLKHPTDLLARL